MSSRNEVELLLECTGVQTLMSYLPVLCLLILLSYITYKLEFIFSPLLPDYHPLLIVTVPRHQAGTVITVEAFPNLVFY